MLQWSTMTRKSWGEKDLFRFYSILLFITEGKQGRNSVRAESWRQELTDADAMEGLCLLTSSHGFSVCFLIEYRTASSGVALHKMGWFLSHQSFINKMLDRPAYNLISQRNCLNRVPLLLDVFSLYQDDIKSPSISYLSWNTFLHGSQSSLLGDSWSGLWPSVETSPKFKSKARIACRKETFKGAVLQVRQW